MDSSTLSYSMRAIIFLDVDGVLIHEPLVHKLPIPVPVPGAWETPDPECIKVLNQIVEQSGARIVVSSCWRIGRTLEELQELLNKWGVVGEVIGRTGQSLYSRGHEIAEWMLKNKSDNICVPIVIIDDDTDMHGVTQYLVKTDFRIGLLPKHVSQAMKVLRKQGWK